MKQKKKGKAGLIVLLVLVAVFAFSFMKMIERNEELANTPIAFNAQIYSFIDDSGNNITESELIEDLGNPDSINAWNFEKQGTSYPIRTLTYGNTEYNFNNDTLQRITLYDTYTFNDKDEIIPMFNLKKYANTEITDTGTSYRAYNCGIHDLWVQYEGNQITLTQISYGDLFS